jgi:ribosomal protein L6P/L9E
MIKLIMTPISIFTKSFIIRGIGYRAQVVSNNWLHKANSNELKQVASHEFPSSRYLVARVGYSSLVWLPIPNHLGVVISKKDRKMVLYSVDRSVVSVFARSVYNLRPPSVYTGRGIRVKKFSHRRKVGKKDARKGKFF